MRKTIALLVLLAALLALAVFCAGWSDGNGKPMAGWTWDSRVSASKPIYIGGNRCTVPECWH